MSIGKTYTLHCNGAEVRHVPLRRTGPNGSGCHEWVGEGAGSAAEVRSQARGWKRVRGHPSGVTNLDRSGYDLCPNCARPEAS